MRISIIIPTYNEEKSLPKTLECILNIIGEIDESEIIVADGGSTDGTTSIAKQYGLNVISDKKGKAWQLNKAVQKATGKIVFFMHADMIVPPGALTAIVDTIEMGFDGGGFDNLFDINNNYIKKCSSLLFFDFLKNPNAWQMHGLYGDNGIFLKTEVFRLLKGFKEIPIMEDYEFSKRLINTYNVRKICSPKLICSSRRILKTGVFKTVFTWWLVQKLYKVGFSPKYLAKIYGNIR